MSRVAQLVDTFNGCSVFEIFLVHVLKYKHLGYEGVYIIMQFMMAKKTILK